MLYIVCCMFIIYTCVVNVNIFEVGIYSMLCLVYINIRVYCVGRPIYIQHVCSIATYIFVAYSMLCTVYVCICGYGGRYMLFV